MLCMKLADGPRPQATLMIMCTMCVHAITTPIIISHGPGLAPPLPP